MVGTQTGFDSLLETCTDERRRDVLCALADGRRTMSLEDLAAAVAQGAGEATSLVEAELHHVHLPRLEEVGLVEYDADGRTAELTERFHRLEPDICRLIDAAPGRSMPSRV